MPLVNLKDENCQPIIMGIVRLGLGNLINRDLELINRKLKEECINHRLAIYIEWEIRFLQPFLHTYYHIDLEYNKRFDEPKFVPEFGNARPDILVHTRNFDGNNALVIEAKKGYCQENTDAKKIKGFITSSYKYSWGVLISYLPNKPYLKLKVYSRYGDLATPEIIRWEKEELRNLVTGNEYHYQKQALSKSCQDLVTE